MLHSGKEVVEAKLSMFLVGRNDGKPVKKIYI
jgi:hypothetical protein